MTCPSNTVEATAVRVRWMIARDIPAVLSIEERSFEYPWTQERLYMEMRIRYAVPMVAEAENGVVGFMFYGLCQSYLHLSNIAIDPRHRRNGIGSTLIDYLQRKLSSEKRREIIADVRETNLGAQLFLKRLGFRAFAVLPDFYEDCDEAAYRFAYRLRP